MRAKALHNCFYCKQPLKYSPLPEMEVHAVKVYFCHTCNGEYLYWKDGTLASHSLYAEIDSKTYKLSLQGIVKQLWYIGEPGIPSLVVNKKKKLLHTFPADQELNITPDNIISKLVVMLLLR